MYVCMYVHMDERMYVCKYVCMQIRTNVRMYVCTYVMYCDVISCSAVQCNACMIMHGAKSRRRGLIEASGFSRLQGF